MGGHGTCSNGVGMKDKCSCFTHLDGDETVAMWTGADCSMRTCPKAGSWAASPSGGRASMSASRSSSSSSIERPSLMRRWMRDAKVDGSSSEKPDVKSDVSYRSQMRSLTVLSDWSASALSRSDLTMGFRGLISMVFFDDM